MLAIPTEFAELLDARRQIQERFAGHLPDTTSASGIGADVLALSPFIERVARTNPNFQSSPLTLASEPFVALVTEMDESAALQLLRRVRQTEMARIAVRDLLGIDAPETVLTNLSRLAGQAITAAVNWAYGSLQKRYGTPLSKTNMPLPLVVLGMGKLGGGELNFSSDIDLIFLYPHDGEIDHPTGLEFGEFFTKLGQSVIRLLDSTTEHGFVYRVDMRLRPFGDSGPLVCSFAFLENYLIEQGRDWERYAWIKARAMVGQEAYEDLYKDVVKPFIYRRYLDFSVFESLRSMHGKILREVEKREWQNHLKLGSGGIREIEFAVQMFQLLRGGSDRRLQTQSLLNALPALDDPKMLTPEAVNELRDSYRVLRRAENRIQMIDEQQTHSVPTSTLDLQRLVVMMELPSVAALQLLLTAVRARVTRHFTELVFPNAKPQELNEYLNAELALELGEWHSSQDALQWLKRKTNRDLPQLAGALHELGSSRYYQKLSLEGKRRLEQLLPLMINYLPSVLEPTLSRFWRILEAIGHRLTYLSLLVENPRALKRLIHICGLSEFLVKHLAETPLLLDELLDERLMDAMLTRDDFVKDLMIKLPNDSLDEEQWIARILDFKKVATFRVALLDLTGRLSLMKVSDRLTDIAELTVQRVLDFAWRLLVERHGEPSAVAGQRCQLAVVAYGKLAGLEMSYGSDLDLVFLYDGVSENGETQGPNKIDNAAFFVRLAQKIIYLLTTYSRTGRLYEVDMRLRPSGRYGLLMSSLKSFEEYQRTDAWTYEHQALLHSRAIAGDKDLQQRYEDRRIAILTTAVRLNSLKAEVSSMRERMRRELSRSEKGQFDLKQDPGGMADIEFLAQYLVLANACRQAPLAMYADTIRQLESLASIEILPQDTVDVLVRYYQAYRLERHHRSLDGLEDVLDGSTFSVERSSVIAVWRQVFEVS